MTELQVQAKLHQLINVRALMELLRRDHHVPPPLATNLSHAVGSRGQHVQMKQWYASMTQVIAVIPVMVERIVLVCASQHVAATPLDPNPVARMGQSAQTIRTPQIAFLLQIALEFVRHCHRVNYPMVQVVQKGILVPTMRLSIATIISIALVNAYKHVQVLLNLLKFLAHRGLFAWIIQQHQAARLQQIVQEFACHHQNVVTKQVKVAGKDSRAH